MAFAFIFLVTSIYTNRPSLLVFFFLFFISALFRPNLLRSVYEIWAKFTAFVGQILLVLILGVVFLAVVTPISLWRRIFSEGSFYKNKLTESADVSVFKRREQRVTASDLRYPY